MDSRRFAELLTSHEPWLMERLLRYALERGYTRYTSTLVEAWRISIAGLTSSFLEALALPTEALEHSPEPPVGADPIAAFAVREARLHRERGVSLRMFLGLMTYYRRTYLELLEERSGFDAAERSACSRHLDRCFERLELAFCSEWTEQGEAGLRHELQERNRMLTNEKNRLLTVFESLPLPSLVLDDQGSVVALNPAALDLLEQQAIPGKQYYGITVGSVVEAAETLAGSGASLLGLPHLELFPWLGQTTAAPPLESSAVELHLAGPPERFFLVHRAPMLDVSRKYCGQVVTIEEVTHARLAYRELQLAKSAAEEAIKIKARFLANLSHEFRTPLTGILGLTALLERTAMPAEVAEHLGLLRRAADNLHHLVNDTLDYTALQGASLGLHEAPFDLVELLRSSFELVCLSAREKGLHCNVILPAELHRYRRGDAVRLQQIVLNMLTNAVKYTKAGSITLKAEQSHADDPALSILVSDTGIGIPEDKLGTIFESFVQLDPGYTKTGRGVGLGLAIVRGLVERMGGTITVHSVLGKGSTFSVHLELPLCEEPARPVDDRASSTELRGARLLLAEDNAINALYLETVLGEQGVETTVVADGAAALEQYLRHSFDLLLLDIGLPELSGAEVARRVREHERLGDRPRVPILGLTGYNQPEEVAAFLEAGMDRILAKPIDERELLSVLIELRTTRS
ncbi:MAG: hypothetical protein A2284_14855 [Deltaproteobacteria bacterium RIFOXYA12_FULL_61_11]|nr:MAG: hypothetical protein A2284_14855 [Deltaproteobacteria bacterium RIFOXYA12_FULL_61_11]